MDFRLSHTRQSKERFRRPASDNHSQAWAADNRSTRAADKEACLAAYLISFLRHGYGRIPYYAFLGKRAYYKGIIREMQLIFHWTTLQNPV